MEPRNLPLPRARLSPVGRAAKFAWAAFFDAAVLAAIVAAGETAGRAIRSDWAGVLLFLALASFGALSWFRSAEAPVARLLREAGAAIRRRALRAVSYGFGFDFKPEARERAFRVPAAMEALFFLLAAAACLLARALPHALVRLQEVSGTAFLCALGLLWIAFAATVFAGGVGVFALAQTVLQEAGLRDNPAAPGRDRKGRRGLALMAAAAGAALLLAALPGGASAFAALAGIAVLHLALGRLPRRGDTPRVLLVDRETGAARRTSLFRLEHALMAGFALWPAALVAFSCGSAAVPEALSLGGFAPAGSGLSFGVTGFAARLSAFLALAFLLAFTWRSLRTNWVCWRRGPARPRAKTLGTRPGLLGGPVPRPWRVLRTRRPPSCDGADLDYEPARKGRLPGEAPPLRRDLNGLDEKEFRFLLDHFDFVSKRREFYRGLSRLLKTAAGYEFASGGGFLLSPHHFFVEGMHRDDPGGPESESRIIGPPFSELWRVRTRQFLYEAFTGMGVDILYFEDCVQWPQLRSVLDQAFEVYMDSGEKRPLRESDFRFLNGVRVFIENLEPGRERAKREGYEEPHFENLSRATVLIVCKDRGGEKNPERENSPDERVPMTMAG
jgi:hypothetical protein